MPPWVPVAVPVGFALWWCFVIWLVGGLAGWRKLARLYPSTEPFQGTLRRGQSIQLGWSNYGGVATVGTNATGLYLAVLFLFRCGHPPMFIPWAEVSSATFVKKWYGSRLELRFAGAPGLVVRFPKKLGLHIAADANRSWADDEARVE